MALALTFRRMLPKNFGFPYATPYPSQLELLNDIYQTIDEKRIGFFESPTGTGKTLTLLCGSLSWLMDHYNKQINSENTESISKGTEPEWIKNIRQQTVKASDLVIEQRIRKPKRSKLNSLTNLEERISSLVNLLEDDTLDFQSTDYSLRNQNFDQKSITPKIIYCSRTHSQLNQVADELRRTDFFSGSIEEKIVNLATSTASRTNLCINKDIIDNYHSSTAINEACNDLITSENGCPYFNRQKDPAFKDHLDLLKSRKILDVEDLFKSGTDSQCCPYFSSRYLVQPASLIITPYNTVLDKTSREAYGIDLSENIIIFDEAHNILDFVKQMNSVCIQNPVEFFVQIVNCLDDYIQKYGKRIRGSNASALAQLRIFFEKILKFLKESSSVTYTINDFIYLSKIDSFNFSRLINHAEDTKLFTKVLKDDLKLDVHQLLGLLRALEAGNNNGTFIISPSEFKYICTDLVTFMSEIIEKCRSVIFCGGTMSPLADLIQQVLKPDLQLKSVAKSISHVICSENINLTILTNGPSGNSLNFSYEMRNNIQMINELGIIITNYTRIIPAGVVIFFPSFAYMDHVLQVWKSKHIIDGIEAIKKIYLEKRGEPSDVMLADYENTIRSSRGAIIFAVMGGKLSEGINFNDNLGRGVITVGLPYPNINEIETRVQMNAYVNLMIKSGSNKKRKQLETDFLENSCMRVLNQTIGRVIRHKNDFAAIVMIDERVNKTSILDKLPKWILPALLDRSGKFEYSFKSISQV